VRLAREVDVFEFSPEQVGLDREDVDAQGETRPRDRAAEERPQPWLGEVLAGAFRDLGLEESPGPDAGASRPAPAA
jgi:hypothetical protein